MGKEGDTTKVKDKELDLDLVADFKEEIIPQNDYVEPNKKRVTKRSETVEIDAPISCLRDEVIIVRHIPRESGMVTNPKHIFYGGMAENATRTFTAPILETSSTFVNVLTKSEKEFLEEAMGLEPNALSVYLKQNNFWDNFSIRLTKGETYLKLSDPNDYIKYKVLLANKDFIAPNITAMQEFPKATYQFVLIAEKEESKESNKKLSASIQAYMIFGKIKDDKRVLKLIVETIDGRPISAKSDLDFIQAKAYDLIQANAKLFVQVADDPYLPTKVLIAECLETNLIRKRGDYLYLASDNSPLSGPTEDPTMTNASKFLSNAKNQEVKLMLEAKLKNIKSQE